MKIRGGTPGEGGTSGREAYRNGNGQQLYSACQERLKALNACDFGDLLLHMLVILRTRRDVLELYQNRFKYILVDEYQDTNQSQYLWLRLLAQERKNRSEERRVGKGGVSTCKSRWSTYH